MALAIQCACRIRGEPYWWVVCLRVADFPRGRGEDGLRQCRGNVIKNICGFRRQFSILASCT